MSMNWVIKDKDGNVTNPHIIGTEDWVKANYDHYEPYVDPETLRTDRPTEEDFARGWRNEELERTDVLKGLDDHPKEDTLDAYRKKLRDWPTTSDFPSTRPTWD